MLTIPKSIYTYLVEKLEEAGVEGIGFDILFQNGDPEEQIFADTMAKYENIVIASQYVEDMCAQKYGEIWNNL